MTQPDTLHVEESGTGAGLPVVLIHGFGGDLTTWRTVQSVLSRRRRVIALDLPGHGGSITWPEIGNAGVAAKAVVDTLSEMGTGKVHLVGHSMGGAVAALCGLREPEQVGSLTLLAPGGFGPEINHRLLRRYAVAREIGAIAELLEQFFGYSSAIPPDLAAEIAESRKNDKAVETLSHIVETLVDGDQQRTLPRDDLAALDIPIKVIWGTQDRVLPTRQSHKLPGVIATHVFDGVGHMPHLEAQRGVIRLILENIAHS